VCVCVCVCVRARACVRAFVCVCACARGRVYIPSRLLRCPQLCRRGRSLFHIQSSVVEMRGAARWSPAVQRKKPRLAALWPTCTRVCRHHPCGVPTWVCRFVGPLRVSRGTLKRALQQGHAAGMMVHASRASGTELAPSRKAGSKAGGRATSQKGALAFEWLCTIVPLRAVLFVWRHRLAPRFDACVECSSWKEPAQAKGKGGSGKQLKGFNSSRKRRTSSRDTRSGRVGLVHAAKHRGLRSRTRQQQGGW